MNDNFFIQYQDTVKDGIIFEFQNDLENFNVVVEKQSDSEYQYATGNVFSDIVLFISENQTSLIVSGVIVRVTYDLLKYSITKLIKGLKKNTQKKTGQTEKTKKISVKHILDGKTIEFEIEVNLSDELIEKAISQSFELLKEQQLKTIINNRDFLSKEYDYKQAKFIFNENSKIWEPINFGGIRKEYEALIKRANEDFNS